MASESVVGPSTPSTRRVPHLSRECGVATVSINAGDRVNQQQLMRVYGALMWSLGRVLDTPEVCRVYVGSFHDEELRDPDTAPLLAAEMGDLLSDLRELPQQSATRRVNELVKRARLLKAHCYLLDHLREQMPSVYGFQKKKQVRDSASPLNFKVTWSRRWRRHDRMRVYASRGHSATASFRAGRGAQK